MDPVEFGTYKQVCSWRLQQLRGQFKEITSKHGVYAHVYLELVVLIVLKSLHII